MREILYGRNAARECLRARRRHVHQLILADNLQPSPLIEEVERLAQIANISVHRASRRELDKLAASHQGVALEVGRYPTVPLDNILQRVNKQQDSPFLLILDHIEDPQNLGAILRTAEVVGIHGVIIPRQRAAGITPAVVNASAGATEHIWVSEVSNLTQTLNKLKQENVWIAGVESVPEAALYNQANLTGALALVVGSEGRGMSRLVKETCDFLVRLPMRGEIESLNASVAAALMLYEVWRARGFQN